MVYGILCRHFVEKVKIKDENNKNKQRMLIVLEGILTILGYYIKPTIVIVTIAICIVEILRCKKIKIGSLDAIYYQPEINIGGLLFNNSEYVYIVCGNISKEELVDIAQNIE